MQEVLAVPILKKTGLLFVLGAYAVGMFGVTRVIVPLMGLRQYNVPRKIPYEMTRTIRRLEHAASSQEEFLELVHRFVFPRWRTKRAWTVLHLPRLFKTNIDDIWSNPGTTHCTKINFLIYAMLAHSKWFNADEIRLRHTFLNGVIHQYIQVRLNGRWVHIDPSPGGAIYPVGRRARYFA